MSRVNKYRAWNTEKKIMCYDNEDGSAESWDGAYGSEVGMINEYLNLPEHLKTYEYMQYIGVKDKNGKEVYEKDIVRIDGKLELFVVMCVCRTVRFGLQSIDELLYFEFGIGSRIEVVGNVYENADLLKEVGYE